MSTEPPSSSRTFRFDVSVKELAEFVWRRGDLKSGLDFTSPRRALEGTLGHQKLQSSRPEAYRAEVPLQLEVNQPDLQLFLRGRIDGVIESGGVCMLEEIKTVTGDWSGRAASLHWAQLKIYGGIWNRLNPPDKLNLRLTYYHLETQTEHAFDEPSEPAELERYLDETLNVYLKWLKLHVDRCRDRNGSLNAMEFPFDQVRRAQQQMLDAVGGLMQEGGALMVEAPTGVGKTMGALYPALKALGGEQIKLVMAVSARTPGQWMFLDSLKLLENNGGRLKVLALTAREKVCRHQGGVCDPMQCAKRVGHFDRLHDARHAALFDAPHLLDSEGLNALGERFQVCPHALGKELVPWVDVIVGDYNYVFDPGSQLGMFGEDGARKLAVALLVDESHNLADRGREMYSQRLDTEKWSMAVTWLRKRDPKATNLLRDLWKHMKEAFGPANKHGRSKPIASHMEQTELFREEIQSPEPAMAQGHIEVERRVHSGLVLLREVPESWMAVLRYFLDRAELVFRDASSGSIPPELLDLYFEVHQFWKAAREEGRRHRLILQRNGRHFLLNRYCLDPSTDLAKTWKRAKSTLFFSATLTPDGYYRSLLGIGEGVEMLRLDSPFERSQWTVLVQRGIATTYRQRSQTYPDVAGNLLALVGSRVGNYLAFFPSYEYLRQVADVLRDWIASEEGISIDLHEQTPDMDEKARGDFLDSFRRADGQTRLGLAVMGGIFGEGIDLMGDRLIGVAVVGVGLPQICMERDLIREHFDGECGQGFDFAYRFPGMNKVLQAVGRLIRSEKDRGVALLIDSRFAQPVYRQLLPCHWPIVELVSRQEVVKCSGIFWGD
jgi:DNA excision repair protein ERCC-2